MKCLVTGGAGYVGVKLASRLLEEGHRVTIYDKFLFGYDAILHLQRYQNLQVVNGDIREITPGTTEAFDVIYHLAGISGRSSNLLFKNKREFGTCFPLIRKKYKIS